MAICGACGLIGDHKKHDNVRLIKDILDDRKTEVNAKVDTLENDVVPKLEHSIQAVDNVSTELTRRADEVRTDIRKAGKQAVEMVEAHVEQMVQEVDDLELSRCKVLDRQRDELQSHLDAARGAVRFRNRVVRLSSSEEETQFSLLHALDARTTSLISTHIRQEPQHHSRLMFKAASDGDVACKAKESLGKLIPCQASAKHSEIEGSVTRRVAKGKAVSITIHAKDNNGETASTGDDVITTRYTAMALAEDTPTISIKNHHNGKHTISCVCPTAGTFHLEVYVNEEKMETNVTITCVAFVSTFDPHESHQMITISGDQRMASIQGRIGYTHRSILGSSPMSSGQYTWMMKIGMFPYPYACNYNLGIAAKPLSQERAGDNSCVAYCWQTNGIHFCRDGVNTAGGIPSASGNDMFQLDLDCDRHTLQIENLRSGETVTFSNLPDKEYFQFASIYGTGDLQFIK